MSNYIKTNIIFSFSYLLGRFCLFFVRVFLVGFGKILRSPTNITCLPENFFSSSRTNLVWIFWKAFNFGIGTYMMIDCKKYKQFNTVFFKDFFRVLNRKIHINNTEACCNITAMFIMLLQYCCNIYDYIHNQTLHLRLL